jgi:hypothetical protein
VKIFESGKFIATGEFEISGDNDNPVVTAFPASKGEIRSGSRAREELVGNSAELRDSI